MKRFIIFAAVIIAMNMHASEGLTPPDISNSRELVEHIAATMIAEALTAATFKYVNPFAALATSVGHRFLLKTCGTPYDTESWTDFIATASTSALAGAAIETTNANTRKILALASIATCAGHLTYKRCGACPAQR